MHGWFPFSLVWQHWLQVPVAVNVGETVRVPFAASDFVSMLTSLGNICHQIAAARPVQAGTPQTAQRPHVLNILNLIRLNVKFRHRSVASCLKKFINQPWSHDSQSQGLNHSRRVPSTATPKSVFRQAVKHPAVKVKPSGYSCSCCVVVCSSTSKHRPRGSDSKGFRQT